MEPVPPGPPPVVGDVQVFLDPECTQYATGTVSTVYVRINVPWSGIDSGWIVGDYNDPPSCFAAYSPSTEAPGDPYDMSLWVDFFPSVVGPYTAGQVVALTTSGSDDVTGYTTVFSKP